MAESKKMMVDNDMNFSWEKNKVVKSQFFLELLHKVFLSLKTPPVKNNWDELLWGKIGVAGGFILDYHRRNLPKGGEPFIGGEKNFLYILEHIDDFQKAHDLLADKESKNLYKELLVYRLLGPRYAKLSINNETYWHKRQQALQYKLQDYDKNTTPASLNNPLETFYYFTLPLGDKKTKIINPLFTFFTSFFIKQYFFQRQTISITVEPNDVILDFGSFLGESAIAFSHATHHQCQIYCFECEPYNLEVFYKNLANNPDSKKNIHIIEEVVMDHPNHELYIMSLKAESRLTSDAKQGKKVPVTTIDNFMEDKKLNRINFIKMDIQGSEAKALKGGIATIKKHKPKLAISIYHTMDDLWQIIHYLDGLQLGYQFYIDHHSLTENETILYAKV
ncbi:MAG: FkbM family methyltransferase [Alphaproteobacteria bacterium]